MNNYRAVLDYLYSQLPMFQRTGSAAYKSSLDNTFRLDEMFGHPHLSFPSVHIGGTNGKGSVSHMLASVFQEAGYKTGLYTSPHLKDFRERIKVNGAMIDEEAVVGFTQKFLKDNESRNIEPSFFELTVMMAFDYFRNQKVDVAIVEVGLGGRLDSTNIITPEVSVITNISFDHVALLGHTLQEIAIEKAGIIKQNIPVVIGESASATNPVFEHKARQASSSIVFADRVYQSLYALRTIDEKQSLNLRRDDQPIYSDLKIDLLGSYQRYNVPTVLCAIDVLKDKGWKLSEDHIRSGLANTIGNTGLMGRWQIISNNPLVVCDTGHNAAGIKLVVEQIKQTPWENLHIVIGMVNDKDLQEILSLLPREAQYYFTKASIPRAAEPEIISFQAAKFGLKGNCFLNVQQAYTEALSNAGENDLIFVGGSTFVVAEIL
jgi:dihydrofolate synthase/folylpolyglutamate synthase